MRLFKMPVLAAMFMIWVGVLGAQTATSYQALGQKWHTGYVVFVPASPATITTSDVLLGGIWISNVTGGAVTLTITDGSTHCGGSACQIWPVVSVAANSVVAFSFGGLPASGGVKWTAGAGTSLEGWMWGNYTDSQVSGLWPRTSTGMGSDTLAWLWGE